MTLQDEIEAGRQTIRTESYSMSIGEIVNLYRDRELVIRPEFQRLFRWTLPQKSRLIESLLLGIPLPSVFLNQTPQGVWEVIDGLQRLSTVLEFMGELRTNDDSDLLPPSRLLATEYLPSLDGVMYEAEDPQDPELSPGQRLSLKRAKIDLKILQPESDRAAKFELFDRLNAGGSVATPQEVRTAQLLLRDPSMASWIDALTQLDSYQTTMTISDRLRAQGYATELVYRYLAIRYSSSAELSNIKNVVEFFSARVFDLAADSRFDRDGAAAEFKQTFDVIAEAAGEDAFRRFDPVDGRFKGAFSVSAFECIAVGVASSLRSWVGRPSLLREKVEGLWTQGEFAFATKSGTSASSRIPSIIPYAIEFFSE